MWLDHVFYFLFGIDDRLDPVNADALYDRIAEARGYSPEMEDFVDAILTNREPVSGIGLARDCVETIYSAYLSAEQGRRVELR